MVSTFRPLLDLHRDLEHLVRREPEKVFISGWDAANPFTREFLGPLAAEDFDSTSYQSYTSDDILLGLIRGHHERFDGVAPVQRVLPGDGSTGLIATMFLWLVHQRTTEVHYVPTVHDTFYYFFDFFGLTVHRAASRHPFEAGFQLELPDHRAVLFVADPTWYVGRSLAEQVLDELAAWQRRTESLIFVDGTWQYLQWGTSRHEASSRLEPEHTIRLVGPTKFLGLNGHRFSYVLLPEHLFQEIADIHENLHGSTSVHNLAFARRAMSVMASERFNRPLTDHVQQVYRSLTADALIETDVSPNCGLYCFARPARAIQDYVCMDGQYYELDGYPGYMRINLLGGRHLEILGR